MDDIKCRDVGYDRNGLKVQLHCEVGECKATIPASTASRCGDCGTSSERRRYHLTCVTVLCEECRCDCPDSWKWDSTYADRLLVRCVRCEREMDYFTQWEEHHCSGPPRAQPETRSSVLARLPIRVTSTAIGDATPPRPLHAAASETHTQRTTTTPQSPPAQTSHVDPTSDDNSTPRKRLRADEVRAATKGELVTWLEKKGVEVMEWRNKKLSVVEAAFAKDHGGRLRARESSEPTMPSHCPLRIALRRVDLDVVPHPDPRHLLVRLMPNHTSDSPEHDDHQDSDLIDLTGEEDEKDEAPIRRDRGIGRGERDGQAASSSEEKKEDEEDEEAEENEEQVQNDGGQDDDAGMENDKEAKDEADFDKEAKEGDKAEEDAE